MSDSSTPTDRANIIVLIAHSTGSNPKLVEYRDSEILTTKIKSVDISKAVRDPGHMNSYGLEEGMSITANWMRDVYNLK